MQFEPLQPKKTSPESIRLSVQKEQPLAPIESPKPTPTVVAKRRSHSAPAGSLTVVDRLRRWSLSISLLLILVGVGIGVVSSAPEKRTSYSPPVVAREAVPNEIVVDIADDATEADIAGIAKRAGIHLTPNSIHAHESKLMVARVDPSRMAEVLDILAGEPKVDSVEQQLIFRWQGSVQKPDDPRFADQWNLALIGVEEAWKEATGKGALVAVIDTGVASADSPQNILIEDLEKRRFVPGFDFVDQDTDAQDTNCHGSHVSGTIAGATNNGRGVAGIAYDARLMPLRVLGPNGGNTADIVDAIRFATKNGANVINMSLGGPNYSALFEKACEDALKAGVLVVCAAGNTGQEGVQYPAKYSACLAVSAIAPDGTPASYTTFGQEIALAAPGGDQRRFGPTGSILQNVPDPASGGRRDLYYMLDGTSMAAPHVSGVAALLVELGVDDPKEMRRILETTAQKRNDPLRYGQGILDAAAAVNEARKAGRGISSTMFYLTAGALLMAKRIRNFVLSLPLQHPRVFLLVCGFFAPTAVELAVGATSSWNLLGHSVLWTEIALRWARGESRGNIEDRLRLPIAFAVGTVLHLLNDLRDPTEALPPGGVTSAFAWLFLCAAVASVRIFVALSAPPPAPDVSGALSAPATT